MANLTVDELTFQDPNDLPDVGPRLSCSAPGQLSLKVGNLRLEDGREVFFSDNGQLRCGDDHRRIVFNNSPRRMEVYQEGDIIFYTGNADAEQMRILGNGTSGVGIGTATPQAKLQVAGGAIMPAIGDSSQAGIQFPGGPTGDEAFIRYFPVAGETAKLQIGIGNDPDDSLSLVQAGAERLTITNGRVGIGTAAPSRALHVEPNEIHSGGTGAGFSFNNRQTTGFVESPTGGERWIWYSSSGIARLWSGSDKLAVTSAGNVGIGTAAPEGKLDVKGDIRAGNSDLYFTKTDHNHTGIGNAVGFAAIENAANYNALMILGRSGTARGRMVRLWDYLQVNGSMDIIGSLGVGTTTPAVAVHIVGNRLRLQSPDGLRQIDLRCDGSALDLQALTEDLYLHSTGANGQNRVIINPSAQSGNVGIGTTAPTAKLHVIGNATKSVGGTGWTFPSDQRLKRNIEPLTGTLERLLQLRGVSFEWIEPEKMGDPQAVQRGLVAQEVETVFPEWVSADPQGCKHLTMSGFEALLIEALRELKGEIDNLKTCIHDGLRAKELS